MINNLELFLKEANVLLVALTEYDEVTDRLLEVDLQQEDLMFAVDDIETLLAEREELRECAESARVAMTNAIREQDEENADLIRCVFEGKEIAYSLTGDKVLAKEVIYKLLAMQKDIMGKDNLIIANLTSKKSEIKTALKNLQGDKKKLDFLNVTAANSQDSASEFNV